MANEEKKPELKRSTTATIRLVKVPLNEFCFDFDRYCHRDEDSLEEKLLGYLMESRILEGSQAPPEFFTDEEGRKVVTKGHRRIMADRALARKNTPGYTETMEIEAFEVIDATPVDLLIRSIADNEVRKDLTRVERIRVAKKLHDNHVPQNRACRAMGVSDQTYERDLRIAEEPWMFQHVIDGSIQPNNAYELLKEARAANRMKEVRADFDAWVAEKKRLVREKEKLMKAQQNKDLTPAEKQVKKYMPNHLVTHWIDLIRKGRRFDEDSQWNYSAGIEKDKDQLKISAVTLDLVKAPLAHLVKVAGKLSQISKQLGPYVQKRHESERQQGRASPDEAPYDFQYLRELGIDDMVDELERQLDVAADEEADGEEDGGRQIVQERTETDLAGAIELPGTEVVTERPVDEAAAEPVTERPVDEAATPVAPTPVVQEPPAGSAAVGTASREAQPTASGAAPPSPAGGAASVRSEEAPPSRGRRGR